jgi:epoxyqueuosine reductase
MNLIKLIKKYLFFHNINYFGVADLSKVQNYLKEFGGDISGRFPFSISLGIALPDTVVDELPNRAFYSAALNYDQAYHVINSRLNNIASIISGVIQQNGYKALPVPASERISDEKICAMFSHKLAANLAGLGWIGKNCLLITPVHGPRVRWVSILTDAKLKPTGKQSKNSCNDCNECVKICPVQAFTGKSFSENEPREARYHAEKCDEYFRKMTKSGKVGVCGMCLYICPFGRRK